MVINTYCSLNSSECIVLKNIICHEFGLLSHIIQIQRNYCYHVITYKRKYNKSQATLKKKKVACLYRSQTKVKIVKQQETEKAI